MPLFTNRVFKVFICLCDSSGSIFFSNAFMSIGLFCLKSTFIPAQNKVEDKKLTITPIQMSGLQPGALVPVIRA